MRSKSSADAAVDAAPIEKPAQAVGAVLVDEDVLGHGEVGDEGELLEHGGDAGYSGGVGVVEPGGLAQEGHLPSICVLCAGDDLDERGLARTVLAKERMDLAGLDGQVDLVERLNPGVMLADVDDLEQRLPGLGACSGAGQERSGAGTGSRQDPDHDASPAVSGPVSAPCGTTTNARPGAPVPPRTLMGAKKKVAPGWSVGMAAKLARHSR